jgi:alkanesulfonate monooxygenase SsuD/methylene tetrahydromethanopterin reductase-like flavin-dependent oxidoreductase (luciferase family)
MATIASSATSVLIAQVAAPTRTIRLGSGGIMLPSHAPLTIAEQFGTLATLLPRRIDLGLGRAAVRGTRTIGISRFVLTEQNAPAVIQICRQLDGIPVPSDRGRDIMLSFL